MHYLRSFGYYSLDESVASGDKMAYTSRAINVTELSKFIYLNLLEG